MGSWSWYCILVYRPVTGHLIACINDIKVLLTRIILGQEVTCKGDRSLLISLMEPPIEYIVKCIFKESHSVSNEVTSSKLISWLISFLMKCKVCFVLDYSFLKQEWCIIHVPNKMRNWEYRQQCSVVLVVCYINIKMFTTLNKSITVIVL